MEVRCTCGSQLEVPAALVDKEIQCGACGRTLYASSRSLVPTRRALRIPARPRAPRAVPCPACLSPVAPGAVFCGECGGSMEEEPDELRPAPRYSRLARYRSGQLDRSRDGSLSSYGRPISSRYYYPQSSGESYHSFALVGFICSLVGISVLGVIFSALALNGMRRTGNDEGHGFAVAGLIIGIVSFALALIWILALVAAVAASS